MRKILILGWVIFPVLCFADDCPEGVVRCGTTDDGMTWSISNIKDKNGNFVTLSSGEIAQELTITGTGDMQNYKSGNIGCPPWQGANCNYGSQNSAPTITSVVIGEGITSIGEKAFQYMKSVTSISLPEGLKNVKSSAFNGCIISELDLPNSLEEIGSFAFSSTRASEIILPENLKKIYDHAFYNTPNLLSATIPENTNVSVGAFGILDELHAGLITIQNIYCSDSNASCQAFKNEPMMQDKVRFYESSGDGYFFNNKWYATPNDIIGDNHIKKRIYTIDEAAKVSKDTGNTFKLRYK